MSIKQRIVRGAVVALAPLALQLGPVAGDARAQEVTCDNTSEFPCSYQLRDLQLQKVPAVFKFQSRVSQAKLPIGEGVFNTVYVKLLRGTEVKCLEQFQNVRVVDSTLNLEIGRNMNCELDEVIAENADLSFQICPGGQENCLQPVSLGSAPYAIKSSFASIAQNAHHANQAGQASYAHRVTADRDLLLRNRIGTGYFDFFTPSASDAVALYGDAADFEAFENSGFIQWTPVRDQSALDIHVCGKDEAQDALVPLDSFNIAAADTIAQGDMTVRPPADGKGLTVTLRGAHIKGDSDIDGELVITMATTVSSGGIHVTGDSNIVGTLLVAQAATIAGGGIHVTGNSDISGELTISQKTTVGAGGIHVTGDSNVAGALDVGGALEVGGTAVVTGLVEALAGLEVTGDAEVSGRIAARAVETNDFDMRDTGGTAHRVMAFNGPTFTVNPDSTLQALRVNGPVRFTDSVIFEGGTVDPGAADAFVLSQGEVRDITLGGRLSVLDEVDLQGGVAGALAVVGLVSAQGGLTVTGQATFNGAASFPGGISGATAFSGGTTFNGAASFPGGINGTTTFNGPIAMAGGIQGAVTFNNTLATLGLATLQSAVVQTTLTVNGAATFTGPASFPGGVSGNVTFANNVNALAQTNLNDARVNGDLTIEGVTTFNGPVDFAGEFTGLTRMENIQVSEQATFNGPVALPGGVIGGLSADSINATASFVADGAATFRGAVSFQGGSVTMPNLVVTGNATFQSGAAFPNGLNSLGVGQLTVTSSAQINASTLINGNLTVNGDLSVARCRICINYADEHGDSGRKHACTQLTHGAFSGIVTLAGDVDDNDVIALKFLCDNGGSESGEGWR